VSRVLSLLSWGQRFWLSPGGLAAFVGCFVFVLYAACVAPTVTYGGDCGELIAASWRLGIAHPTGYALYLLTARCFALLLPFGEVAWRYNLFSAFCGAASIGLVAATVSRLTRKSTVEIDRNSAFAAVGGALLLGALFYFWSQCVLAEVYAFAALLFAALFFCAVSWRSTSDWRWLYSLALVFGLALNAHLSCVYLAPGLFLFAIWGARERFSGSTAKQMVRLALFFVAGYSIALYLPLRSATFPSPAGDAWHPLDWTHPVDAARFWIHATARQYRIWLLTTQNVGGFSVPAWVQSPEETRAKLLYFAQMTLLQLNWCAPFACIGCVSAFRRDRMLGAMLLLTVLLNVGVQIHYTVGDLSNFFFPSYLVLGIWLGLGIYACARRWNPRIMVAAVAGTFLLQLGLFFPMVLQRGKTRARDVALARAQTLEKLPRATAFLLSDDALWAFWYAQFVLQRAPHVETVWGPPRTRALKNNTLWQLVAKAKRRGPVVVSMFDEATDARFPLVPASATGDLWLASDRQLPLPAQKSTVVFDRTSPVVWRAARRTNDVPRLKRSDMAACEVVFQAPRNRTPLARSAGENTVHCGWIELLVAKEGMMQNPSPSQRSESKKSAGASPLVVWRVSRRLILPSAAQDGVYRATIPVTLEKDARLGVHSVWMRIVRDRNDARTLWQRAGKIELTDA
jgi:hypothetical protein